MGTSQWYLCYDQSDHMVAHFTQKNSFRPQATSCFIRILIFICPRVTSFFPTKMRFRSNFTKTQSILDLKVLRSVDSTTFQFNYRKQKTSESQQYFAIKLYYKTIFQTYRHRVCKYIRRYLAYLQIWTFQHFRHIKCNSPKATIYTLQPNIFRSMHCDIFTSLSNHHVFVLESMSECQRYETSDCGS